MRRLVIAVLLGPCFLTFSLLAQSGHPGFRQVADLGGCSDGGPKLVYVTDGNSATDCSVGLGTTEVLCGCQDGAWVAAGGGGGGTDDQTAVEVPYAPTTGTDWVDPDPTEVLGGLDDLAGRLTTEEAKADDDVPEAGDFGALALTGPVTSVGLATTVAVDAVGLSQLDDDANTPLAGNFIVVETGAASVDYLVPHAGTDITADLEEEGQINATVVTGNTVDDQVLVGTGASTLAYTTVQNCNDTTEKLDWNGTAFTCVTDQTGGGGGLISSWKYVQRQTSTYEFTDLAGDLEYEWVLSNVDSTTDNNEIWVEVSTDNGSTWKSTSYLGNMRIGSSGTSNEIAATTRIPLTGTGTNGLGNAAGESGGWKVWVTSDLSDTANWKHFQVHGELNAGAGVNHSLVGSGAWVGGTDAIDAIRFVSDATITGSITMWQRDLSPSGTGGLTVEEADASPTVSQVDAIQFDQADGFTVTDETGGQVQVDLFPRAGASFTHATDCTSITTGVVGDICVELDSENLYSCQPTAGGCDTAGEWILTGDGAGGGTMSSFDITDTDASPILTVDNAEQIQFIGAGTVTVAAAADASNHDVTITGSAHFSPTAGLSTDHGAGAVAATTDLAGALCGTGEYLVDDGASWSCDPVVVAFSPTAGISTDHGAGAVSALTDIGDLCAGNEILERNAGDTAWTCIATPGGGGSAWSTLGTATADSGGDTMTITDTFAIDLVTGNDPEDISADFNYTGTLAGDVAMAVEECVFTLDGASGGGFLCEGTAANANEQLLLFPPADDADLTWYIATDNDWVRTLDGTGLQISVGVLSTTLGTSIDGTEIVDNVIDYPAVDYTGTLAGNPGFGTKECWFSSEGASGGGILCEGTTANTNEQLYLFPALDGVDTTQFITINTVAQTLANKTLTTPTIASFTNAQHTHLAAASGGALGASSVGTSQITDDNVQTGDLADGADTPVEGEVVVVAATTTNVEYVRPPNIVKTLFDSTNLVATDDIPDLHIFGQAAIITGVKCISSGGTSATITLEDDAGNDLTTSCACAVTLTTCSLTGFTTFTADERLDLAMVSISGAVTSMTFSIGWRYDL